ncbi:MAG: hypothetical protein KDA28_02840, partial [Phycisphaerales bacterium]|nr:hypothetical protein [Phycisphaerales bacterium]
AEVFQLAAGHGKQGKRSISKDLKGRILFSDDSTYEAITGRVESGSIFKATTLSEAFDFNAYRTLYGARALMLFVIDSEKRLQVITSDRKPAPVAGDVIVSLVNPDELFMG